MIEVRPANLKDIDFIIETIISAEKSGSDKLGLATLFNLSEDDVTKYLRLMLEEEIDGCEFSLHGFLVADVDGVVAGAAVGWIEGENEDMQMSAMLKSNMLGYFLPKESIEYAGKRSDLLSGIQIERELGVYQIEYVYANPAYRSIGLMTILLNQHIAQAENCKLIQVQTFANNNAAISLYRKLGFEIIETHKSVDTRILNYLPYNEKVLMQKNLN